MKAFWIALTVLLLLIAAVVGNCVYVGRVTDALLEEANALPDLTGISEQGFAAAYSGSKALRTHWEKQRGLLAGFVHFDYLVAITQGAVSMERFAEAGEAGEYAAARELLIEAIRRLADTEKPSLGNIL